MRILDCPMCGGHPEEETVQMEGTIGLTEDDWTKRFRCLSPSCGIVGKGGDSDGKKWNEMVVNIRAGELIQMGVEIKPDTFQRRVFLIKLPHPEENVWKGGFATFADTVHYGWMRMIEWRKNG